MTVTYRYNLGTYYLDNKNERWYLQQITLVTVCETELVYGTEQIISRFILTNIIISHCNFSWGLFICNNQLWPIISSKWSTNRMPSQYYVSKFSVNLEISLLFNVNDKADKRIKYYDNLLRLKLVLVGSKHCIRDPMQFQNKY